MSLHTTGTEELATEIRINANRYIIENWDNIYKDSFEFPYIARIGCETMTFNTEQQFLIFLMEKGEEASAIWMTHVKMQAVSTMLNLKIISLPQESHLKGPIFATDAILENSLQLEMTSESTIKMCTTKLKLRRRKRES